MKKEGDLKEESRKIQEGKNKKKRIKQRNGQEEWEFG